MIHKHQKQNFLLAAPTDANFIFEKKKFGFLFTHLKVSMNDTMLMTIVNTL